MDTTRCFVALPIQPPASAQITQLQRQMSSRLDAIRWVALDTIHITLKFVGDIPNLDLPKVCDAVSAACAGLQPFGVSLSEFGVFPSMESPRVLWVGIDDGQDTLRELRQKMDEPLLDLGVPIEQRQFNPHLTLGRLLKDIDTTKLADLMQRYKDKTTTEFLADRVVLYSSTKHRGAFIYEPIHTVHLS